jgi:hypothetical protein
VRLLPCSGLPVSIRLHLLPCELFLKLPLLEFDCFFNLMHPTLQPHNAIRACAFAECCAVLCCAALCCSISLQAVPYCCMTLAAHNSPSTPSNCQIGRQSARCTGSTAMQACQAQGTTLAALLLPMRLHRTPAPALRRKPMPARSRRPAQAGSQPDRHGLGRAVVLL